MAVQVRPKLVAGNPRDTLNIENALGRYAPPLADSLRRYPQFAANRTWPPSVSEGDLQGIEGKRAHAMR